MKLQDYIHYYIGCRVFITDCNEYGRLMGGTFVPNSINQIYYMIRSDEMAANEDEDFYMPYNDDADDPARIKPILRKLEDMDDDDIKSFIEWDRLSSLYHNVTYKKYTGCIAVHYGIDMDDDVIIPQSHYIHFSKLSQLEFHHLLKEGFDLFNLIKYGLAIDSKTLK